MIRSCRELCDGLHSNVHLTTLDLRLSGNQLEAFMRDYAARFATIPSLTALDLAGCGKLGVTWSSSPFRTCCTGLLLTSPGLTMNGRGTGAYCHFYAGDDVVLCASATSSEEKKRNYRIYSLTCHAESTRSCSRLDLDNEIPTLLGELKKNRQLKSLHLGRNFNNIKQKNMQRTISAMKDLIVESVRRSYVPLDSLMRCF